MRFLCAFAHKNLINKHTSAEGAIKQHYRIRYKVVEQQVIVTIVVVGIRKEGDKADVYTLAKKLIKLGLSGQD